MPRRFPRLFRWSATSQQYASDLVSSLCEDSNDWFTLHEWERVDLEPLLPKIRCRTLVVTGNADWAVGAEAAAATAALLPWERWR